jgi:Thiamine pyrophosphate-requiring enzymes [acetolactate synthase, pyruvate dehydrogenase (cytochrome), glyoxylate carboligase, phosphonopyruvate decarboxylase]
MKAAELVVRCLEHEGVELLFALPGEETLHLTDALLDSRIRVITTRHEQGAAFMADVYGRLTGKAGVCLSTLGPGATNLLTGVADANMDHAPLVALTGQSSLNRMHKESHQYIDVMAMFKPVTKWQAQIAMPAIIPEAFRKAFKVAQTEKPGATHLELPENISAGSSDPAEGDRPLSVQAPMMPEPLHVQVQRAIEVIQGARRPLILAGNGVVRRQAHEAVRHFAGRLNIPVVHTFMGKGILPDSDPLSLYTIGFRWRDYSNLAMEEADVVIAVGYDFVEYAPCFWNPNRDKHIVHIDATPAEVDAHYIVDVGVLGDPALSLERIGTGLKPFDDRWAGGQRERLVAGLDAEAPDRPTGPLRPQDIIRALRGQLRSQDIVICDVGAHKLWMARMFPCELPNTCLISNGYAAMGIGLPGAIAAKLAYPDRRVITVTGDGGFLMNIQELETAVREHAAIIVLVWRDNGYGVIRWNQQKQFGRTGFVEFGNPDFVKLAQSFGAEGMRVTAPSELRPCLIEACAYDRPVVIDCPVDYSENMKLTERLRALGNA